jgi:tetratricopeptide (TPR) repeat protein
VRRNRGTFAALAVIAVVMVGATIISSVMYTREQAASRAAQREATRSSQVSRFLGDMLTGVGPHVARGRDTELLEAILEDTDKRLGAELADQPEVEAALRLQLSHTYRQLGDWDTATKQLERVKELQSTRNVASPDRGLVASAEAVLAWARGDLPAAETLYRESLAAMSGQAEVDSLVWAESALQLGNIVVQMGRYDEADSLMNIALSFYRRRAPESDVIAVTYNSLGNLARYQGDYEAAEVNYREALAIHRRVLGENHPFIATDLHNLGRLLESRGNIPDAEQLLRESMAVLDKVYDGPHADKAQVMRSMAEFYMNQMRLAEADSLIYGSLAMTRQLYGEQADDTNRARLGVAEFLQRSGRLPAAEAALTDLLAVARKGPRTDPELLPDVLHRLATTIVRQGRDREALPLFEESIALYTALAGADHPTRCWRATTAPGRWSTWARTRRPCSSCRSCSRRASACSGRRTPRPRSRASTSGARCRGWIGWRRPRPRCVAGATTTGQPRARNIPAAGMQPCT